MRIENTTTHIAVFIAVCLAVGVAPTLADTDQPAQAPSIARMARLPVTGLQVVETNEGELLFLSDNGRYALRGRALDLWHGARLVSYEETIRLAGRIDLARLKLDVGDLGAIDVGEGPEVVAFV
ncbi:MAG: DsbC family protein, partial [Chromatiaceae bacterium]